MKNKVYTNELGCGLDNLHQYHCVVTTIPKPTSIFSIAIVCQ